VTDFVAKVEIEQTRKIAEVSLGFSAGGLRPAHAISVAQQLQRLTLTTQSAFAIAIRSK